MNERSEPSKPPIKKFRVGNISVNIWEREHEGKTFHNFTVERSYKDDGEWKSSGSFDYGDMGSLELCMGLAKKFLASLIASNQAE